MLQFKKNLFFNLIALSVNIGVGFFYTPYLVESLGIIAYGIVPLALIINQYIFIFTSAIMSSLTRFYTVNVQRAKFTKASIYISTTVFVLFALIIFSLPLVSAFIYNLELVFNIPVEYVKSAKLLFLFTFSSFYFSLISSFLNIPLYANNKLDIVNQMMIGRSFLKVVLTVLFFEIVKVDIVYIGMSNFITEIFLLFFSIYFFRKNIDRNVKITYFHSINRTAIITVLTMAIWVITQQWGEIFLSKADVLFVNKIWGTKESGVLGAISDLYSYVLVVFASIIALLGPILLNYFSNSDYQKIKELMIISTLIIGIFAVLVSGTLIGFSREFLSLWLNVEFGNYSSWLIFKLLTLPYLSSSIILLYIFKTWNKIKLPAIYSVFLACVYFFAVYFISKFINNSLLGTDIIIVSSSILLIIQYFLHALLCNRLIPNSIRYLLLVNPMKFSILLLFICILTSGIKQQIAIDSWSKLIISCICTNVISVLFVYFFLLSKPLKKGMVNSLVLMGNKNN